MSVTVNFAHDYHAEGAAPEDITDGDRTQRHCYKLTLLQAAPDATYHRIELWVEQSSSRPIKARFFFRQRSAAEGRLLPRLSQRAWDGAPH